MNEKGATKCALLTVVIIVLIVIILIIILFAISVMTFLTTNESIPFMFGGYQCDKHHSKYLTYPNHVKLTKFQERTFQIQNGAFLAILYQNISQIPCIKNPPEYPSELSSHFHDIFISQSFYPIRNKIRVCRISYTKNMDIALIYMQSAKTLAMSVDILDTSMLIHDIEDKNIKVYAGMINLYRKFEKEMKEEIQKQNKTLKQIVFFGHSVGGALAYYGALDIVNTLATNSKNVFVYTFGSVRPGNIEFARYYNSKVPNTFRIINDDDIFGTTPGSSELKPYRHVGNGIYVNFDGTEYHAHSIKDYADHLLNLQQK